MWTAVLRKAGKPIRAVERLPQVAQCRRTGSAQADRHRVLCRHPAVCTADGQLDSTDTAWILRLGNFADEAWLFFRANEGTPGKVTGGELTRLTGNLYLLKANADTVRIEKKGA